MGTGINRSRVFFRRPVLDSATSSVATASVATRFVAASAAAGFVATGFVATGFVATDFVATASVATAATSPTDGRQSRVLQLMLKCWAGVTFRRGADFGLLFILPVAAVGTPAILSNVPAVVMVETKTSATEKLKCAWMTMQMPGNNNENTGFDERRYLAASHIGWRPDSNRSVGTK